MIDQPRTPTHSMRSSQQPVAVIVAQPSENVSPQPTLMLVSTSDASDAHVHLMPGPFQEWLKWGHGRWLLRSAWRVASTVSWGHWITLAQGPLICLESRRSRDLRHTVEAQ